MVNLRIISAVEIKKLFHTRIILLMNRYWGSLQSVLRNESQERRGRGSSGLRGPNWEIIDHRSFPGKFKLRRRTSRSVTCDKGFFCHNLNDSPSLILLPYHWQTLSDRLILSPQIREIELYLNAWQLEWSRLVASGKFEAMPGKCLVRGSGLTSFRVAFILWIPYSGNSLGSEYLHCLDFEEFSLFYRFSFPHSW